MNRPSLRFYTQEVGKEEETANKLISLKEKMVALIIEHYAKL